MVTRNFPLRLSDCLAPICILSLHAFQPFFPFHLRDQHKRIPLSLFSFASSLRQSTFFFPGRISGHIFYEDRNLSPSLSGPRIWVHFFLPGPRSSMDEKVPPFLPYFVFCFFSDWTSRTSSPLKSFAKYRPFLCIASHLSSFKHRPKE